MVPAKPKFDARIETFEQVFDLHQQCAYTWKVKWFCTALDLQK
jgi:hypothetical protein